MCDACPMAKRTASGNGLFRQIASWNSGSGSGNFGKWTSSMFLAIRSIILSTEHIMICALCLFISQILVKYDGTDVSFVSAKLGSQYYRLTMTSAN